MVRNALEGEAPADEAPRHSPISTIPFEGDPSNALHQRLCDLLYRAGRGETDLVSEIPELEKNGGIEVYAELLYVLSHLRFEPDEAKRHWKNILDHRDCLQKQMESPIDPRVALVSYFLQVHPRFEIPKLIELVLFEKTRASVYRDELTGLYNFRFFKECLTREILRSERFGMPLSLVMVDIDNFKTYNDRNGHECANRVLRDIGPLLTSAVRNTDFATRYGGDEFALILSLTPKCGAEVVAERVRNVIERYRFRHENRKQANPLTVSVGVASFPADASSAESLVRHADRALYDAKNSGRNQVWLSGESNRSFRRLEISLPGKFRVIAEDDMPLTALEISEGGMRVVTQRSVGIGSLIDVDLQLPDTDREISVLGRVVRVERKGQGKFETAVQAIVIQNDDRELLRRYLRKKLSLEHSGRDS